MWPDLKTRLLAFSTKTSLNTRLNAFEYERSNAVWIMFKRCFKKIQTRKKRVQIKHGITQSAKQCYGIYV